MQARPTKTRTKTQTQVVTRQREWKALAATHGLEAEQAIAPSIDQPMLTFLGLYGTPDVKRNVYFNPCTPREIRGRIEREIFA